MEKEVALLPPMLFAPVGYYLQAANYASTAVDYGMRPDKRFKQAHRYKIIDTRGELTLTVPVKHLSEKQSWDEVEISDHNQWWRLHLTALESAYGRTPYFEFYIDKFLPLLQDPATSPYNTVGSLCRRADYIIRNILLIAQPKTDPDLSEAEDLRKYDFESVRSPWYWQLRADRLGFHPSLSILDMIFNIGPESQLLIHNSL